MLLVKSGGGSLGNLNLISPKIRKIFIAKYVVIWTAVIYRFLNNLATSGYAARQ